MADSNPQGGASGHGSAAATRSRVAARDRSRATAAWAGSANDALYHEAMLNGEMPRVSWEKIVDHIVHVAKLAGVDHVGLGSDFDGATMPIGMESAANLPKITDALLKRGYSESDVEKILGGNSLRVMEAVERASKR
jgi:microsomal dipeptidase-like Zn-dependent dipeptidase